jgi:hypothetical protein
MSSGIAAVRGRRGTSAFSLGQGRSSGALRQDAAQRIGPSPHAKDCPGYRRDRPSPAR